ncbi:hypothetical protein CHUAL_013199 [Chamberlinius hualienensis]
MLKKRNQTNSHNNSGVKASTNKKPSRNKSPVNSQESEDANAQPSRPLWKHILRRVFILLLAFVGAYITASNHGDGISTFVESKNSVSRRSFEVPCSQDYDKEKQTWPNCVPKRCGRVVTDELISSEDADHMLKIAQKGFSLGKSSGGASILDLHSGALSKGNRFINIYMSPESKGLFTKEDFRVYRRVRSAIHMRIMAEFGANQNNVYLTHPTFFSRITDELSKTIHDEYWHPHVDKETYGTFQYTSLLYLNTYNEDFEGGRFVFMDEGVNRTVEPRKGILLKEFNKF